MKVDLTDKSASGNPLGNLFRRLTLPERSKPRKLTSTHLYSREHYREDVKPTLEKELVGLDRSETMKLVAERTKEHFIALSDSERKVYDDRCEADHIVHVAKWKAARKDPNVITLADKQR